MRWRVAAYRRKLGEQDDESGTSERNTEQSVRRPPILINLLMPIIAGGDRDCLLLARFVFGIVQILKSGRRAPSIGPFATRRPGRSAVRRPLSS